MNAQAMDALRIANEVRVEKAAWRRHIFAQPFERGIQEVITLLRQDEVGLLGAMTLGQALGSVRKLGPTKIDKLLIEVFPECRVSGQKQIRQMTIRQRERLAARLELLL